MILLETSNLLKDRRILVAVSGSIAVYKILDAISLFKKLGAQVRVVMSQEAQRFVTPLSFEALTHAPVLCAESESWDMAFNEDFRAPQACNHISYAKWAEVILIAPASANTIAKLSCGMADNVLLSTILASSAQKILAPAMNTQMLQNPITQNHLKTLQDFGFKLIPTRTSLLACDTYGDGALEFIDLIVFEVAKNLLTQDFWNQKQVIITGGGSKEAIDSIRCISNHSSGRQASSLACALYLLGAEISFISSSFPIILPKAIKCCKVSSAQDYQDAIRSAIANCSPDSPVYLFMAAAIADFIPIHPQKGKIKKGALDALNIACIKAPDILSSLSFPNLVKIGFKAEFDSHLALQNAQDALTQKSCQAMCLNILSEHNAFDSKHNAMILLSANAQRQIPLTSKLDVGFEIARFVADVL